MHVARVFPVLRCANTGYNLSEYHWAETHHARISYIKGHLMDESEAHLTHGLL